MVVIFSLTDDLYMESEVTNRATTGKDGSETHHFGMVLAFIYGYIRYIMEWWGWIDGIFWAASFFKGDMRDGTLGCY